MPESEITLYPVVVMHREDGHWFAHATDLDNIGDGETPAEALDMLQDAIWTQRSANLKRQGGDVSRMYTPAEAEVFRRWNAGRFCDLYSVRATREFRVEIKPENLRVYEGPAEQATAPAEAPEATAFRQIGARLREIRISRGRTLAAVAEEVGMEPGDLALLESGEADGSEFGMVDCYRVAEAVGVRLGFVLTPRE